ncbi:MAG: LiaI-LiaF-like domain-containing protein [Runella sp.]
MQNPKKTIFWAVVFVAVGVLFLLRNFGLIHFVIDMKYIFWTGFATVFGINAFLDGKRIEGAIWVSVGLLFLVPSLMGSTPDWFTFKKLWPVIPIAIGLNMVMRYFLPEQFYGTSRKSHFIPHETVNFNSFEKNAVMAGVSSKLNAKAFEFGKIGCVMAGVELDMSEVQLNRNARMDLNVIMGGIELLVPKEWNIKYNITPIMGGVEDNISKFPPDVVDQDKQLIVSGVVIMGAIDVKRI